MHELPAQVAHPNSWWVPVACDVSTMTDFILKCCVTLWTDPAGSPSQLQSTFHWLWQLGGATFGARSDNSLSWNQFGRCWSSHSFIERCLAEATEHWAIWLSWETQTVKSVASQWRWLLLLCFDCVLHLSAAVHFNESKSHQQKQTGAWISLALWLAWMSSHDFHQLQSEIAFGKRMWPWWQCGQRREGASQQSASHSVTWCCNSNLCHCETEMHFYWIIFYYQTKIVEPAILSIMRARSAVTTFLYVNSFWVPRPLCVQLFLCRRRREAKHGLGMAFKMFGFGPSSSLVLFQQSVKWNGTWQASAIFIKTHNNYPSCSVWLLQRIRP